MDELPEDLRSLLALARDEHDPPDDGARKRVRIALAASIGAPTAGALFASGKAAAATATKTPSVIAGSGSSALAVKVAGLALGALATLGVGFAIHEARKPAPVAPAVQAATPREPAFAASPQPLEVTTPTVEALPSTEPAATAPAATEPAATEPATTGPKVRPAARPAGETLAEEIQLMRAASAALARGDELEALNQLQMHSRRYPRGSLREERDGLRAIAECTRDDHPSQEAAQRFAKRYPGSVLAARVAGACRTP